MRWLNLIRWSPPVFYPLRIPCINCSQRRKWESYTKVSDLAAASIRARWILHLRPETGLSVCKNLSTNRSERALGKEAERRKRSIYEICEHSEHRPTQHSTRAVDLWTGSKIGLPQRAPDAPPP